MLLSGFAVTALLLAAVGVYGLISYSVAQRTREIGIRVALGARPRQVVNPIVREGMTLAAHRRRDSGLRVPSSQRAWWPRSSSGLKRQTP